jgi:hypothetical protein
MTKRLHSTSNHSEFPSPEKDEFLKNLEPIEGTTHMYPLTESLFQYIQKSQIQESQNPGVFYKSDQRRASSPVSKFNKYNGNNITKRQKINDHDSFDGKPISVRDGLIVTTDTHKNIDYNRHYFWVKPTHSKILKNFDSRSARRSKSRKKIKAEKAAKKLLNTKSAGSISKKKQKRRSYKTIKSR